jgi:hypothetical protein
MKLSHEIIKKIKQDKQNDINYVDTIKIYKYQRQRI